MEAAGEKNWCYLFQEWLKRYTSSIFMKEELIIMTGARKEIGLAIIGCGTIGRIRAEMARAYPGIGWLGLCDLKEDLGQKLVEDTGADFFTTN